jgi:hypothetical protein
MSEAEVRAYVIADNRLAENAGWDRALLGLELQYLTELEIDFDVTVTALIYPTSIYLLASCRLRRVVMIPQMLSLRSRLALRSAAQVISGKSGATA